MIEWRQDQSCLSWLGFFRNKGHNPENLSWVQVAVKMVSLARELGMVEEQRQNQSFSFWQGDHRDKGHNPEKVSWVRVPVKVVSVAKLCVLAGKLHEQIPQP
jgi:hypothetical protein